MYAFAYHRPASLAQAVALLAGAEDGRALAGGQTLLPTLRQRLGHPTDLVDVSAIPDLKGIAADGDGVTIGAFARHAEVAAAPAVRATVPVLADLAASIGDRQVRNLGTLGGSIANADPAADYAAALLALDGQVRTDRRTIAAAGFFTGLFETALAPGELVVSARFARPDRAAYAKFRNPASRYAIAGVLVACFGPAVRVAVIGAGANAFRAADMEAALAADFRPQALAGIAVDPTRLNSDMHAANDYRAHLVGLMARRAVEACLAGSSTTTRSRA
jgi:carbon-monoxide dehydrogenase medium subunit